MQFGLNWQKCQPWSVWMPFSQLEQPKRLVPKWDKQLWAPLLQVQVCSGVAQVVVGRAAGRWLHGQGQSAQSCLVLVGSPKPKDTWGDVQLLGYSPACPDTPNLVVCVPKVFPPGWKW